jgi:uncharacterized protein (DUF1501 family)
MQGPDDFALSCLADCERVSRRQVLGFSAAFAASLLMPSPSSLAAARDPRFLFVNLRGALDGLSAVMPLGDPDFERVRDGFMADVHKAGAPIPVGSMFALNPALKTLGELFAKQQASIVHAVATPYRERSHFDGQEVLESGLPGVTHDDSGWLNRAIASMRQGPSAAGSDSQGLVVGSTVPLVMRGTVPVMSWTPKQLQPVTEDTVARLLALYQSRDPLLAQALEQAGMTATAAGAVAASMESGQPKPGNGAGAMLAMAEGAARLLVRPDGPRIATLQIDGWDTHADEKPGTGRLAKMLVVLDQLFDRLRTGLAPVWQDTVIVAATEFGRTVRINGTAGTDHGTGTVAFLLGGAVKGGRVIADWPGLADRALYENRDLKPTTDLRAVLKPILAEHLGIDVRCLNEHVFPGSTRVASLSNLVG